MEVQSLLIVCHGNICRSPMAEAFFRHQRPTLQVSSAGLIALVNESADPLAQSVMQKRNIDISSHRARQVTESIVRTASLVFVMTEEQLSELEKQFFIAKGKTFLLGHWEGFEIDDPFTKPEAAFEKTYEQIERAWEGWKQRI